MCKERGACAGWLVFTETLSVPRASQRVKFQPAPCRTCQPPCRILDNRTLSFPDLYRKELTKTLEAIDAARVEQVIEVMRSARDTGHRIFTCGNGGSASSASHFVCDMVKGASYGRDRRFKIMALTDQMPAISAYANDVGYEAVFVEQLKNFAESGDVLLAISGSGNSPNVLRAVEYAKSTGCTTIGFTGRGGGKLASLVDLSIVIDSQHMGRIEDAHMIMCHMIGYYFMEQD